MGLCVYVYICLHKQKWCVHWVHFQCSLFEMVIVALRFTTVVRGGLFILNGICQIATRTVPHTNNSRSLPKIQHTSSTWETLPETHSHVYKCNVWCETNICMVILSLKTHLPLSRWCSLENVHGHHFVLSNWSHFALSKHIHGRLYEVYANVLAI